MKNEVKIRIACADDAENLLKIYSPYIEKTAITFEYTAPTAEEFRERIEKTLSDMGVYVGAKKEWHSKSYGYKKCNSFR